MKIKFRGMVLSLMMAFFIIGGSSAVNAISIDKEDESIEEYQAHWDNYFPDIKDMEYIESVTPINDFDLEFVYWNNSGQRITTMYINSDAKKAHELDEFSSENKVIIQIVKGSAVIMVLLVSYGVARLHSINKKFDSKEE